MSIKSIFAARYYTLPMDLALLLIRVVAGVAFVFHGWGKIQNPFGWIPSDPATGGGIPGIFQALAAISEFGGGIAWALGFLFPLSSFGLMCTMAVATFFHAVQMGDPFVATGPGQGSYEPALGYFCLAILFITTGPGRFSLDNAVFGKRIKSIE